MSFYLRNFDNLSTSSNYCCFTDLNEENNLNDEHSTNINEFDSYFDIKTRQNYSKLLLICSKQFHQSGILHSAKANLDELFKTGVFLISNS